MAKKTDKSESESEAVVTDAPRETPETDNRLNIVEERRRAKEEATEVDGTESAQSDDEPVNPDASAKP